MIAEKVLLGSFLKANYLLKDTVLNPEQLADTRHQHLFKVMMDFSEKQKSIDAISLSTLVNLENFGGISYLNELQSYSNVEKFDEYESLIIESWKGREKLNILSRAKEEDWEIANVISALDAINETKVDDHTSISDALADRYDAPWEEVTVEKGVPTGILKLDQMTNGFQDSELTIIGARPSMGKTDVLIHLAKQAGWHKYLPIVFSLEMPESRITDRLIASTGRFNRMRMHNVYKGLTDKQKEEWPHIIGHGSKTNIQIFDRAGQTVAEMRAKTRKMLHVYPDKKPIIFIDYLTLIKPANFYGGNAHQQVTEISKSLKNMAKEFSCPVICLAQLNRSVESRADKRPMMSDIRESGSVEQDADTIMFLYREKYYDKSSENDLLELILSKNRNGPVGTVYTKYKEETGEVIDLVNPRNV